MKDFFKPKTWLITALMFFIAFTFGAIFVYYEFGMNKNVKVLNASISDNVSGWAWSSNVGWISFNSIDCDTDGDLIYEGLSEGNPAGSKPAPADCPTSGAVNDYAVNIDTATGNFSGSAWSSSVGWISFNRAETGNPPADPYLAGPGPIAKYNTVTKAIDGWAKILTMGDDGWIMLNSGSMYTCPNGGTTYFTPAECAAACTQTQNCSLAVVDPVYIKITGSFVAGNCPNPPGNNKCVQASPAATYGSSGITRGSSATPPGFTNGTCYIKSGSNCYIDTLYTACRCPIAGGGNCSLPAPGTCIGPLACVPFTNSFGLSYDTVTKTFSGWAWNANSNGAGIGWISFNCNDAGAGGCTGHDYKVMANLNTPPTVSGMTAPNWNYAQASTNALRANLQFDFVDVDEGSSGSAYQIVVTKADDTPVLDTGKCTGVNTPSANCKFDNTICMKNSLTGCINPGDCVCTYPLDAELNYNTGYQWSVKVWDEYNLASATTTYNTNPDTHNDDGVVLTFTTYKHNFPLPSATYFPLSPSRGEKVKFISTSNRFFTGAPTSPVACTSSTCDWNWILPSGATFDSSVSDNNSATSTPIIIFDSAGSLSLALTVTDQTDSGGIAYYSTIAIPISVNAKLPNWREVKPE